VDAARSGSGLSRVGSGVDAPLLHLTWALDKTRDMKKLLILRILGALALLSLIAVGSVTIYRTYLKPETEAQKLAKVLDNDKRVLGDPKAKETDVYAALVRLGDRGVELSKQEAIKRSNDSSLVVRKGAAEALGYFVDEGDARDALERMINEKDEETRIIVLKAVGVRGGEGRAEFLKTLFRKIPSPSELEREAADRGLLRVGSPTDRKEAADRLIALYRKSTQQRVKFQALLDLTAHLSRDPRILDLVEKDALRSPDPSLQTLAIRHIAAIRDKTMGKLFEGLLQSPNRDVRLAIAQALPLACPDSRYVFAETLVTKDTDEHVRIEALNQIERLGGDPAKTLLERLIKSGTLKETELAAAKKALKSVEKDLHKTDVCVW